MRIVLKNSSSEGIVLCDGPEGGQDRSRGPDGYAIRALYQVEAPAGARAASVMVIERGNVAHAIRFGITRECASHSAAIVWVNNHLKAIAAMKLIAARDATKVMSLLLKSGAYSETVTPVVLDLAEAPRFIGATVSLNYSALFGGW